ncbi:NAD(P)/FAD-dependent oxidoreductase [Teredinibacter sp. KSP-S5-2]|uniref:flavin-containing monooxygenase n=1 Tax=Teredinibacter sp. KSP-S5-2 TaxID=3034506 RepID=UPI0029345EE6|nr:NAD(P)/FAD-dependent oxidoreductase [Teredinibacter sp. KSP-S5-2]WNO10790.1 NAD(P)/FAD-dependent oxidoreductase [Teredinibacter sp. KSP-S5-2]
MKSDFEVVIVGAGQAGLSVSYYLAKENIDHVILEQDSVIASSWKKRKWDSFTLITPNSMNQLPDFPAQGFGEDEFLTKEQVCMYVDDFAGQFDKEIRFNVRVSEVVKEDDRFVLRTNNGVFTAKQVVVATSAFNKPRIPEFSNAISSGVTQTHSSEYKNPESLPDGAVLVVGVAQSGAQIVDELVEAGRDVFCSTSRTMKMARRYRGKDTTKWARLMGFLEAKVPMTKELGGKFPSSPQVSGKNGGKEIHLQELARSGLKLLGKMSHADGDRLFFDSDLVENMTFIANSSTQFLKKVDEFIETEALDCPAPDYIEPPLDDYAGAPQELSISQCNISSIIWASGYQYDFSWIHEDVFDEFGYPIAERGVTQCPGLYFVGIQGVDLNKSTLLYGVGQHAKYIAECVQKATTKAAAVI